VQNGCPHFRQGEQLPARDSYLVALGARIAKLRRERKLTQEELSERAHTTSKNISAIERGIVNPSVKVVRSLALGMGVTPARLLAEDTEVEAEIASLLAHRSAAERAQALRVVRALWDTK
jgi:transcriptional regulator with XRE-family HTH domain